jgi:ubiquinol-cytochrome c reductase cytochrome c1 subunit
MNRFMCMLILMLVTGVTSAADGHGPKLLEANVNLSNKTSLQRGAQLFVNYCLSCHSAHYMRYNRMAADLELTEQSVAENLMFASEKIGDTMTIAMSNSDSAKWFGVSPPDLSVIARARGADWLFSFLNGFYLDDKRPTGVNNLYFPDTAMPHVLWELQGLNKLGDAAHYGGGGHSDHGNRLESSLPGKLSQEQYQQATRDLVAFLVYVGEPAKLVRYRIGFWVIVFLSMLLVATYLLKQEYWKDVH